MFTTPLDCFLIASNNEIFLFDFCFVVDGIFLL